MSLLIEGKASPYDNVVFRSAIKNGDCVGKVVCEKCNSLFTNTEKCFCNFNELSCPVCSSVINFDHYRKNDFNEDDAGDEYDFVSVEEKIEKKTAVIKDEKTMKVHEFLSCYCKSNPKITGLFIPSDFREGEQVMTRLHQYEISKNRDAKYEKKNDTTQSLRFNNGSCLTMFCPNKNNSKFRGVKRNFLATTLPHLMEDKHRDAALKVADEMFYFESEKNENPLLQ